MIINKLKNILNIKGRSFTTVVEVLGMLMATVIVCAMLIVVAESSISINKDNIKNDTSEVVVISKAESNILHSKLKSQLDKLKSIDISNLSEEDKNDFETKLKKIEELINRKDYNEAKNGLLDLSKERINIKIRGEK